MVLKKIGLFVFTIRMLPIYFTYLVKVKWLKDGEAIKYKEDTRYFKRGFFQLLYEKPEYICILYMRLGAVSKILRYYKRSYPCFLSDSQRISGGVYIDHPHGTHINVNKCGRDLHIKHNVTIGNNHGGIPTIGNNVSIGCGACVLGDITIGDNVNIGANCVVVKSVPSNVTVIGNPAYIVKQDGNRTNVKL